MRRRPTEHDHGYKRLFSHPETVQDLLRGFLPGDWVERLDLATLERVSGSFIARDLRERRNDILWRVRWREEDRPALYLYVLLELQSTSDAFMAVRLLTYVGLLLEEIIHREKLGPGDRLPAVLPLVLYNGPRPWRAPLDLSRLFAEVPKGLRQHLPRLRYFLLDENRLDLDRPDLAGNRLASLFRIETSEDVKEIFQATRELARLLRQGEEPDLRTTFTDWVLHVLQRLAPGATIPAMTELEEVSMLEENFREWMRKKENLQRREGRAEGKRELLLQLLERRFGPLSDETRRRVEEITSTRRLNSLADKILTAGSLREMGL